MLSMTEGLSGGGSLTEIWHAEAETSEGGVMRATGETLAKLHTAGYLYGDCRWENLFRDGKSTYLTNLDYVRKAASGSKQQARDIAQFTANAEWLGIGLPLYEQFLEAYLQGVSRDRREVVERMMPAMYRLRSQHLAGYGQRLV